MSLNDTCEYAKYLASATAVQIIQWLEIGLDFVAFCSLTLIVRSKYFRKMAGVANKNLKIICVTGIFCYYVATLFSFVLHVYFKVRAYTSKNSCDYLWFSHTCIIYRLPVYYCFVCFSFFHLSLFIERAVTTFCKRQQGVWLGILLSVLTMLLPLGVTSIPLSTDNFMSMRPYCFSNSSMKPEFVVAAMLVTAVSDVLVTAADIYIYIYNKRSLKNKHSTQYTLDNAFRLRETKLSMEVIIPYANIHAIVFMIYVLSVIASNFLSFLSSLDRTSPVLQTVSVTKSVYLAGVPLLVMLFVKDGKKDDWLVKQTQVSPQAYFDQFNSFMQVQKPTLPPKSNR